MKKKIKLAFGGNKTGSIVYPEIDSDIVGGIAVHPKVQLSLTDEITIIKGRYRLSHEKSGWAINHAYYPKKTAIKIRRELLPITDWTQELTPDNKLFKRIKKPVRMILDKYQDEEI